MKARDRAFPGSRDSGPCLPPREVDDTLVNFSHSSRNLDGIQPVCTQKPSFFSLSRAYETLIRPEGHALSYGLNLKSGKAASGADFGRVLVEDLCSSHKADLTFRFSVRLIPAMLVATSTS